MAAECQRRRVTFIFKRRYWQKENICLNLQNLPDDILAAWLQSMAAISWNIKKILLTAATLAAVIAILYLYTTLDPDDAVVGRFFPKCPVKLLTGLQCPGCGLQRALHSLMQGDVIGALRHNWFLVFSLSYLLGLLLTRNLDGRTSRLRRWLWGKWGCSLFVALYAAWFVVRNLLGI